MCVQDLCVNLCKGTCEHVCLQGQDLCVSVGMCVIVRMQVLYLGIVCMCVLSCVESAQIFTGVSGVCSRGGV